MTELNVGGHLSLGRDRAGTIKWAAENGFRSVQIFASNPAAWRPPSPDRARGRELLQARLDHGIDPLFIHAIYLINLASKDQAMLRRSIESLVGTMRAIQSMEALGLVTHVGSHGGQGRAAVMGQIVESLLEVLEETPETVQLILENSAGSGDLMGVALDELGEIIARAGGHPRLRVALDTAHLFSSGWDFRVENVPERLGAEIGQTFGLERLALIHANDSAYPCRGRRDRHANIGEGHIGREGFRNLLARDELRGVPWILETPNLEQRVDDLTALHALSVRPLSMR